MLQLPFHFISKLIFTQCVEASGKLQKAIIKTSLATVSSRELRAVHKRWRGGIYGGKRKDL